MLLLATISLLLVPPAPDTTFDLDPVVLIDERREIPGDMTYQRTVGTFTYTFSSLDTLITFQRNPDRYAARLGGSCARMGALSGTGSPEHWYVHNDGLYFCASESCLRTFKRDPDRTVDRDDDPPASTPESLDAGRELMNKTLVWAGGRERLASKPGYSLHLERDVPSGDTTIHHTRMISVRPPDERSVYDTWDDVRYGYTHTANNGQFYEPRGYSRSMSADQIDEAKRDTATELPAILVACAIGQAHAVDLGDDEQLAGRRLAVHLNGRTNELVIDPETGAVIAQRFRGRAGPDALLGGVERRFTAFVTEDGIRFPDAWEQHFDGQRDAERDRAAGTYTHSVTPTHTGEPMRIDP